MDVFFKNQFVRGGMLKLLDDFCKTNLLISPVQEVYNISDKIPFSKWLNLLRKIYLQCGDDTIGVKIGAFVSSSHIGISSYLSGACSDFQQYIDVSSKYNRIWYNHLRRDAKCEDGNLIIVWSNSHYSHLKNHFCKEIIISEQLQVSILFHRIKYLVHGNTDPLQVDFTFLRPQKNYCLKQLFNCPVSYNQSLTRLTFPKEILSQKLKYPDPVLYSILSEAINSDLENFIEDDPFLARLNQAITKSLHDGKPNIEYVSSKLNVNIRYLQNRLKKDNLNFKIILNRIRLNLAKLYLKDNKLLLQEITYLLAYKEQTSFNRAFKRWTGLKPLEWREKELVKSNHFIK